MDIESYLKIRKIDYKEYKIIRFNHYEKKYGKLQEHEFINMIRYVPENCLDNEFYFKYIKTRPLVSQSE